MKGLFCRLRVLLELFVARPFGRAAFQAAFDLVLAIPSLENKHIPVIGPVADDQVQAESEHPEHTRIDMIATAA